MNKKDVVVAYSTKVLKFKQITTKTFDMTFQHMVVAYSTKVLKFKQITTQLNNGESGASLLLIVQRY